MPKFTKLFNWGNGGTMTAVQASDKAAEEDLTTFESFFEKSRKEWIRVRRPFLNLWPSVVPALGRTDMNLDPGLIPRSVLHELGVLEVRCDDDSGIRPFAMMLAASPPSAGILCVATIEEARSDGSVRLGAAGIKFGAAPDDTSLDGCGERLSQAIKLSLGILLLAADPDYLTPILLNRDAVKEPTGDALAKAIERAKRNGRFGFDIGAQMEVSPHFRRPHFGLRWTGTGRTVPRLVPVKGCIVKRSTMQQVPTGYHDDQVETECD